MAEKLEDVYFELSMRDTWFRKQLASVENALDSLRLKIAKVDNSAQFKGLERGTKRAEVAFSRLGQQVAKVGTGLKVAFAGVAAYLAHHVVDKVAEMAKEQIQVEAKLRQVMKTTGQAAGITAGELLEQAHALEKVTLFTDEATVAAQTILSTFKSVKGDVFKDAVQIAQDLSTVWGGDLTTSMKRLGKALEDPVKGLTNLRRVGIIFTREQNEQIAELVATNRLLEAQQVILTSLRGRFGGAAKAAAATPAGRLEVLSHATQNLGEEFGKLVIAVKATVAEMTGMSELLETLNKPFRRPEEVGPRHAIDKQLIEIQQKRAAIEAGRARRDITAGETWWGEISTLVGAIKGTEVISRAPYSPAERQQLKRLKEQEDILKKQREAQSEQFRTTKKAIREGAGGAVMGGIAGLPTMVSRGAQTLSDWLAQGTQALVSPLAAGRTRLQGLPSAERMARVLERQEIIRAAEKERKEAWATAPKAARALQKGTTEAYQAINRLTTPEKQLSDIAQKAFRLQEDQRKIEEEIRDSVIQFVPSLEKIFGGGGDRIPQ